MAISWNIPALVNKIASDIPGLNTLLQKLATWNMDGTSNLPNGAKRMVKNSNNTRTIQEWNGSAWGSVGKLAHDVETVDGFSASQSAAKNCIAVRDASGRLPGDLTGMAATANKLRYARTIGLSGGAKGTATNFDGGSNITIPVTELDVSKARNGMLPKACGSTGRTDGFTADVYLSLYGLKASEVGQLSRARSYTGVDANNLWRQGTYNCYGGTTALHWPYKADWLCHTSYWGDDNVTQMAFRPGDSSGPAIFFRTSWDKGKTWKAGWECAARVVSSDVHIYVAKDGSDAYSGLESNSPVLTWARAVRVLMANHTSGACYVHFGKGDWGSITIGAACRFCHTLVLTRFRDNGVATSYQTDMPHFTYISDCQAGRVYLRNLDVDKVDCRGSRYELQTYNRIGRVCADQNGNIYVSGNLTCKYIDDTNPIFLAKHNSFIHFANPVVTMNSGLKASSVVYANFNSTIDISGSTQIKLASGATYTGKRCSISNGSVLAGYWTFINTWPGSGTVADHWQASFSGIPQDVAIAGNTGDRANATRGIFNARNMNGGTNLNNLTAQGIYQIGQHNGNANLPAGCVNGTLCVFAIAGASTVKQIFYRQGTQNTNDHETYVRQKQGSSWSSWIRMLTTKDIASSVNTSTTQIPTCKAVNDKVTAVNNAAVLLKGNQTVNGVKTFTNNPISKNGTPHFLLQSTNVSKGSNPSSNQYWCIPFTDKNGTGNANRLGLVETRIEANGNVSAYLVAYQNNSGSTANASMGIVKEKGGGAYGFCPTPPAGDNSTKIATTNWVRNYATPASNADDNSAKLASTSWVRQNTSMVPGGWEGRSSGVFYTAECNGWVYGRNSKYKTCGRTTKLLVNGVDYWLQSSSYGSWSCANDQTIIVPVKKGQRYKGYNLDSVGFLRAQ